MKFKCENCGTRYNIADHKVRNKVLKIRCKVCENVIILREAVEEVAESPSAEVEWYLAVDGDQLGPMPFERLRDRIRSGEASPDDVVWNAAMADWRPIGEVAALAPLTKRTPIPLPARPSMVGRRVAEDAPTVQRGPTAAETAGLQARAQAEADAKARAADGERKRNEARARAEEEAKARADARAEREAEATARRDQQKAESDARRDAAEATRREAVAEREAATKAKAEAVAAQREAEAAKREAEAAKRDAEAARREAEDAINKAAQFDEEDDATTVVPDVGSSISPLGSAGIVKKPEKSAAPKSRKSKRRRKSASAHASNAAHAKSKSRSLPPVPVASAKSSAPPAAKSSLPPVAPVDAGPTELVPILPPDTSVNPAIVGPLFDIESLTGFEAVVEPQGPGALAPILTPSVDVPPRSKRGALWIALLLLIGGGVVAAIMFSGDDTPALLPDAAMAVAVVDAAVPAPDAALAMAPDAASAVPDSAIAKAPDAAKQAPKPKVATNTKPAVKKDAGSKGVAAAKPKAKSRFSNLRATRKDDTILKVPTKSNLPETLSSGQINNIMKRYQRSIHGCYQRQLKRDPSTSGRAMLRFKIQPSGRSSNVRIDRKFNGTVLKSCLQSTVKRWRFPEFTGRSIPVEYPLIFQASL